MALPADHAKMSQYLNIPSEDEKKELVLRFLQRCHLYDRLASLEDPLTIPLHTNKDDETYHQDYDFVSPLYVVMDHNWGSKSLTLVHNCLQQEHNLNEVSFYTVTNETRKVPRKRPLPLAFTRSAPLQRLQTQHLISLWYSGITPLDYWYRALLPHQVVNVIPAMQGLFSKDLLTSNLQNFSKKHGESTISFYPLSFNLPAQLEDLRHFWHTNQKPPFILKPTCAARGNGIKLMSDFDKLDLSSEFVQQKRVVAQQYIRNPLLIEGYKITWRIYVVITCLEPLRIYIHKKGLTSLSSKKYSNDLSSFEDTLVHLTNADLHQEFKKDFVESFHPNIKHEGLRCDMEDLLKYMQSVLGADLEKMWDEMRSAITITLLSMLHICLPVSKECLKNRTQCFQMFGYDFLVDDNFKPWILEINMSPQMHHVLSENGANAVKKAVLSDLFNLVDINRSLYKKTERVTQEILKESKSQNTPSNTEWLSETLQKATKGGDFAIDLKDLSPSEISAVVETHFEQERSRELGWDIVFPNQKDASQFLPYLEYHLSQVAALWVSTKNKPNFF